MNRLRQVKLLLVELCDELTERFDNFTARECRRRGDRVPDDVLKRREQRAARRRALDRARRRDSA